MNDGILLVNKPKGITTFDIIRRLKKLLGRVRVGHTGSLDPLAEGLVILCLGKATRISSLFIELDKEYRAEITLGARSSTYDADGELEIVEAKPHISEAQLKETLNSFMGVIEQRPPLYSAIKHKGRRLYEYAREGIEVEPRPRMVEIKELRLLEFRENKICIECLVSSGTYIRSLAHEIGERLNCGAYISGLTRLAIGPFNLDKAKALSLLESEREQVEESVIALSKALPFLTPMRVKEWAVGEVRQGRPLRREQLQRPVTALKPTEKVAIFSSDGSEVLAIYQRAKPGSGFLLKPFRVLV